MSTKTRPATEPLTHTSQGLPRSHAPWAELSPYTGHWTDCKAYDTNDEADCDCT